MRLTTNSAHTWRCARKTIAPPACRRTKRVSPRWGLYGGIESVQDETELIGEAQLHMSDRLYFRFNLAYGLSSKATDWSPDVGVVFAFPSGK